METNLPTNDLELKDAFGVILSIESFSDYINEIVELVYYNELNRENIYKILKKHNISDINGIKEDLLDLLIVYTNLVLNDHIVSTNEIRNIRLLKMYFGIEEGDFVYYRKEEIEDILKRQFKIQYFDDNIIREESVLNSNLQEIFDLSYDQFDILKEVEVKNALERGAEIQNLDTAKFPNAFKTINSKESRQISQEVKDLVWNRDQGKCITCGSNHKLEYGHIIPFSKGGSSTYRNIQLLCETCNRKKTNAIG